MDRVPGGWIGVRAWSISRSVLAEGGDALAAPGSGPGRDLRVLAVFDSSCNLVSSDGSVVALVTQDVGDGPLNIVLDADSSPPGERGPWPDVPPGARARWEGNRLVLGALQVELEGARLWEPRPGWDRLRSRLPAMRRRLPRLRELALAGAPEGSLLALPADPVGGPSRGSIPQAMLVAAGEATTALRAGWVGDLVRLRAAAAGLAGLGGGLTPSGDDCLSGAMLWAWLEHPEAGPWCEAVRQVAEGRTTTLSAALLRAAARGECGAAWHLLLAALADEAETRLADTVRQVLAHGHTSGGDALAGFLWVAGAGL